METFFAFLFIFIVFIPIILFYLIIVTSILCSILWIIDKHKTLLGIQPEGTEWSLSKRIKISSILHAIILFPVIMYLCFQNTHMDTPLEYMANHEKISIPRYRVIKTTYPAYLNRGDDYCVDQIVQFGHSPSRIEMNKLNEICRKNNGHYYYEKNFYGGEEVMTIEFDFNNNKAYTRYHKR